MEGYSYSPKLGDIVEDDNKIPPYHIGRIAAAIYVWQGDEEVMEHVRVDYRPLMREWYLASDLRWNGDHFIVGE